MELSFRPHYEFDVCPVSLRVGGEIIILKENLFPDFFQLTRYGFLVQLRYGAVFFFFLFRVHFLIQPDERLVIIQGQLCQVICRIARIV